MAAALPLLHPGLTIGLLWEAMLSCYQVAHVCATSDRLEKYYRREVHPVATSSITKQFVAKDSKAFEKLLKEAEKTPERTAAVRENSSLDRGRKALKQFSLR